MKLLTKEIAKRLPPLYSTEEIDTEEKIAQVKFFHPCGRYTFFACEGNAIMPDGSEVPLKDADLTNEAPGAQEALDTWDLG